MYRDLLFDLDNTLLDFGAGEKAAFSAVQTEGNRPFAQGAVCMSQYDFLKNFHFAAVHAERLEMRPAAVLQHAQAAAQSAGT